MAVANNALRIAELNRAYADARASEDYRAAGKYDFEISSILFAERLQVAYDKVALEWSSFGRARFIPGSNQLLKGATPDQLIIDRGELGSVTLVFDTRSAPPSMSFQGATARDPEALILAALHAKKYWRNVSISRGFPEFVFLSTVANELVGVRTPLFSTASLKDCFLGARPFLSIFNIPRSRRAEAEELKKKWQPIYERLLAEQAAIEQPSIGRTPERPAKARRDSAPVREAAVAAVA